MKCQIKTQKGRASPTQTWIALGKLVATEAWQLHFFAHYFGLKSFYTLQAVGCPKVVIRVHRPLL